LAVDDFDVPGGGHQSIFLIETDVVGAQVNGQVEVDLIGVLR
jgi:hypothetical protein